jgi:hypothetical protein
MTQWGRGGTGLLNAEAMTVSRRYGQRSVWLAAIAFVLGIASLILLVNVPKDLPPDWQDIADYTFVALYLGVAPLLHLVGIVFGLQAIFRAGERRGLGLLGLVLNVVSVMIGTGFVYVGLTAAGRFT